MNHSFGLLLREYRNRCIDPQTSRRLSQERLAALVGETLGTTYTAQAVSDWERDKSQIHKDHRQVLIALIQVLHTCGGLSSPEDAERLLAAGNYRALSHVEAESIFLLAETDPPKIINSPRIAQFLGKFNQDETTLPYMLAPKITSVILCWLATWLAISPILDFSNSDPSLLLKEAIILSLTGLAVPVILAWVVSLDPERAYSLPERFLHLLGGILGFSLGLTNVLALANLSYNLHLYPWPPAIVLLINLWPVSLGLISATRLQTHSQPANGEIRFRDIRFRWAILFLPLVTGLGIYHCHHLLTARLLGPFLLILLSIGLGLLLWSQTRKSADLA